MHRVIPVVVAAFSAALVASPTEVDARVSRSSGLANRKDAVPLAEEATDADATPPLLGTLVQTHSDERVPLDDRSPSAERFAVLLRDRVTGEHRAFDPKLLALLRSLAHQHPGARFELVSGYRSPKINEMMRKKGRHVASHSQHSLGHAVDFRVVEGGAEKAADPRTLEREIRDLGWDGGIGVYMLPGDRFVHADVGRRRRWGG